MIIRRYIYREIALTLLAVTAILFLVYTSNRFVRYLADAAAGSLSADVLAALLGLKALTSLPVLVPLAFYLAVLLGLGRLYRDSEMSAFAACGVGLDSMLRSVFRLALVCALAVAGITFYAVPWAQDRSVVLQDRAEASADISGIASGRFKESKQTDLIFYTESVSRDQQQMDNVFAWGEAEGRTHVLTADSAYQTFHEQSGDRFVVFVNGYRYEGVPGTGEFKVIRFREYGVRVKQPEIAGTLSRLAGRSTSDLWKSGGALEWAELHWRFSMPLSVIILGLIAVTLSRVDPRQGRFARVFAAILVYVVYSNMMGVGRSWLERGVVPSWLGLWWVHIAAITLFFVLWVQQFGAAWVFRRVRRVRVVK